MLVFGFDGHVVATLAGRVTAEHSDGERRGFFDAGSDAREGFAGHGDDGHLTDAEDLDIDFDGGGVVGLFPFGEQIVPAAPAGFGLMLLPGIAGLDGGFDLRFRFGGAGGHVVDFARGVAARGQVESFGSELQRAVARGLDTPGLLGGEGGGFDETFESGDSAGGFDLRGEGGGLEAEDGAKTVGDGEISGAPFDGSLIAGGALEEECGCAGEGLFDGLAHHADPVGADHFVFVREDDAVTLIVDEDGVGLALGVVEADDDEVAINGAGFIAADGGGAVGSGAHAAIDVDGADAFGSAGMDGAEVVVGLDDDPRDTLDEELLVLGHHLFVGLGIDVEGAFVALEHGAGVGVRGSEADVRGGNAGGGGGFLDGCAEVADEEGIDVDHGEFLFPIGENDGGGDHAGRVNADGFDVGLGAPVEVRDADGGIDIGAGNAGLEAGGFGVFRGMFDDIGPGEAGEQKGNPTHGFDYLSVRSRPGGSEGLARYAKLVTQNRMIRLSLLVVVAISAFGQKNYIKSHYTKYEHRIAMRDGKKLFTSVYVPKDTSKTYPILITRTPYSIAPYGADQYPENFRKSEKFTKEGFIFVFQDVRGRYMSEGEYVNVRPYKPVKSGPQDIDETTDTYDTIDWLVKHVPGNNGRAGIHGISYPGFYAGMGAIDAHPALKASSPQAPVTDWFVGDDFHHNGAFYLPHFFRFFTSFGLARPEPTTKGATSIAPSFSNGYEFYLNVGPLVNLNEKYFKNQVPYWNEFIQHPNYDEYWKVRDLRAGAKNVKPAMMTVGGWFDAEDLFGALKLYEAIETKAKTPQNMLVMGPWAHGQWGGEAKKLGHVAFNADTGKFYRDNIEFPFFMQHLKEKSDVKLPKAYMFETGANQWRKFETWPPKEVQAKTLYFQADGKLSFSAAAGRGSGAFDEYLSDPNRPVPFTPGITKAMTREHMVDDQRFASTRPDVLVYQTEALENDVVIAGPLEALLHVSTTGTDADFVVKLVDVYPDDYPDPDPNPEKVTMGGYQQLVRGELFRGRFRNGYEKPVAFTAGKVEKIKYELPDVLHNFRRGHRIMIQVQSSWFPLIDRNPQKYVESIYNAKREDFIKATHRVYRSAEYPSSLKVLELK